MRSASVGEDGQWKLRTWESHRRLSFLQSEEHYDKIGLDDGKEIFFNDVLETAEWCTLPWTRHV
jgi:hypothetical protein